MLSFDIRSLESHAVGRRRQSVGRRSGVGGGRSEAGRRRARHGAALGGRAGPVLLARHDRRGRRRSSAAAVWAMPQAHVTDEAHLIFAEAGDEDDRTIPMSTCSIRTRAGARSPPGAPGAVAARGAGFALCRDDCKGLCPRCGADLNAGPCDCAPQTADPRWDALRKLDDVVAQLSPPPRSHSPPQRPRPWPSRSDVPPSERSAPATRTRPRPPIAIQKCPRCQAMKRPHHVCAECGYYAGEQRVAAKEA